MTKTKLCEVYRIRTTTHFKTILTLFKSKMSEAAPGAVSLFSRSLTPKDQVNMVAAKMKVKSPRSAYISYMLTDEGVYLKRYFEQLTPYIDEFNVAYAGADCLVKCGSQGQGKVTLLSSNTVIKLPDHAHAVEYVMSALKEGYTVVHNPHIRWNLLPLTPENFAMEFISQAVEERASR
jgi:hypothetical protein